MIGRGIVMCALYAKFALSPFMARIMLLALVFSTRFYSLSRHFS